MLNKDGNIIEVPHGKKKVLCRLMLPVFDFEMVHTIRKNENTAMLKNSLTYCN